MASCKILGCMALALILAVPAWTMADDEDHLAKAPPAVQATAKKILGDKKLQGFDKEVEDGKTVYEMNYSVSGGDYAVVIGESGDILEREVEIDMSAVPDAILATAKKAEPDGKIGEVAIVEAQGKLFYEVESKVDKDTHEIKVNADGTLISDKVAAPEADADGEKADKEKKD